MCLGTCLLDPRQTDTLYTEIVGSSAALSSLLEHLHLRKHSLWLPLKFHGLKQVYAAWIVGVYRWSFWYCEKTCVDCVTLQDNQQPRDNVSNEIKFGLFLTSIELSLDMCDEKLHCRSALMKIQVAGRWFTDSCKHKWCGNSRWTSLTAVCQTNLLRINSY